MTRVLIANYDVSVAARQDTPGSAAPADIMWGKTAWVNGELVTGTHRPPVVFLDLFSFNTPYNESSQDVGGVHSVVGDGGGINFITVIGYSQMPFVAGRAFHLEFDARVTGTDCFVIEANLWGDYTDGEHYTVRELHPASGEWVHMEINGVVPEGVPSGYDEWYYEFQFNAIFDSYDAAFNVSSEHQNGALFELRNIYLTDRGVPFPGTGYPEYELYTDDGVYFFDLDTDMVATRYSTGESIPN